MNNMQYIPQMQSISERINNPPKLSQCIQMHNEEELAPIVLKSIYDEVDQIIVIEGAVANRPKSTSDGHSVDKTWEIIQDFVKNHDPKKKVLPIRIKKPWKNLEELKQTFIDLTNDGDWLIINDADEIYRPEDIRRVRKAIELHPHACEFIPTFLHFYRDFKHLYAPAAEWQPQHQRIFKRINGMKYHSHPIITLPDGHCSYFSPHMQHRRFVLDKFFIFHYGYARSGMDQIMQEKQEFYKKELSVHGRADIKFDAKVSEWVNRTEPNAHILEFPLEEHPAAIREHPMFQFLDPVFATQQFKPWTEDRLYSKILANQPYGNIWLCMNQISAPAMSFFHNQISLLTP
jgi:hypothetical protein